MFNGNICQITAINFPLINMSEENICLNLRLRKIDETRNHFSEDTKQRDLMNKKQKKVCKVLNYIEQ